MPQITDLISYDPVSGVFRWKVRCGRQSMGGIAGHKNNVGYLHIRVNGKLYLAHRLAWFLMTGRWPMFEIDHKDQNPLNNRWNNLREATYSQNRAHKGANKNNILGIKGVRRADRKFIARIWRNGRSETIGRFETEEAASQAYFEAAKQLHGEFAHG